MTPKLPLLPIIQGPSVLAVLTACFFFHGSPKVHAQAPGSIAGITFSFFVTNAITPPFAPPGSRFLLMQAVSGNDYQTIGINGPNSTTGTYSYSASSAVGTAHLADSLGISLALTFGFDTASTGTYYVTAGPNEYQGGDFEMFAGPVPNSINGSAYYFQVEDGSSPFAGAGSWLLQTAAVGTSYTLIGDGLNTGNSSGNYYYAGTVNPATGRLVLNDSVAGSSTIYLSFSNGIAGGFALTQPSSGGFQAGHFINLQTAVQITSPTASPSYTSAAGTIDLGGTASDNLGISQVIWTNNLGAGGMASGTTNWRAAGIPLQNAVNFITVTALGTVGNTAQATITVTHSPALGIALRGGNIVLSWPTNFANFNLQSATDLGPSAIWTTNSPPPTVIDGKNTVTNPISGVQRFYRLAQ